MSDKSPIQQHEQALHDVIKDIALNPVPRPAVAISVTPKGQKLINHYLGGYHYFTVA